MRFTSICQPAWLAQSAERVTLNHKVAGSTPALGFVLLIFCRASIHTHRIASHHPHPSTNARPIPHCKEECPGVIRVVLYIRLLRRLTTSDPLSSKMNSRHRASNIKQAACSLHTSIVDSRNALFFPIRRCDAHGQGV
ncbi:hypothetical protein BJX70DRAFT_373592, partial [Aspergillus crustosus]